MNSNKPVTDQTPLLDVGMMLDTLQNPQSPFQMLIENSSDIVTLTNNEGVVVYSSPSTEKVLGYGDGEFVGHIGFEFVHPDDLERIQHLFSSLLENPSNPYKAEFRLRNKAGLWLWMEGIVTNLLLDPHVRAIVVNFRDVTERKQTEETLRKNEELLRNILETLPVGVLITDQQGQVTQTNPAFQQLWGGAKYVGIEHYGEYSGWWADTGKRIEAEEWAAARAIHTGEVSLNEEIEIECFDGTHKYILNSAVPIRNSQQEVTGVIVVEHDITERKQAENELTALYNATSFLFKSDSLLNLGYQVVQAVLTQFQHADCGLLLKEKASEEIVRLTRSGVYQVSADSPLSLNGQGIVPEALRTGKLIYSSDVTADQRYLASDPRTRSELVIPLKTARGTLGVLDLQSMNLDAFSSRDQRILSAFAERAAAAIETMQLYEEVNRHAGELEWRVAKRTAGLQRTKDQVEAILNQSSDAILLVSATPHIQQSNPAFSDLMGYTFDDVFKKDIRLLAEAASAPLLVEAIEKAVAVNLPRRIEVVLRRKDGSTFDADVALAPMAQYETDDVRVICSIRDNTEQKRAEEDLRKALATEKELNELKSRFVSMVSHDFRTPLATIQSSSDLLRHYNDRLTDERKQEHFNTIHGQIEHLTGLLDDVITINQADSVGIAFRPLPTDLVKLCQTIVDEIQQIAGTRQIKLAVNRQMGSVEVDTKLLRRALVNLLSNAVKYSPEGSHIDFSLFCENKQVVIRIKDQGIGIPEDDQKRLFEVFHRSTNVGSIPGTGLGLAIVKRAVEAHGGSITVDSQIGAGTTFTISLPIDCAKAEQA